MNPVSLEILLSLKRKGSQLRNAKSPLGDLVSQEFARFRFFSSAYPADPDLR